MSETSNFSQRKHDLYPVTWFREPYSLLAAMLGRLYGLPNCSVFKVEQALTAHHVLTTRESFPWDSILTLELKTVIEDYQKATARKKPNFFFSTFVIDVFFTEFQYPNLGWNQTLSVPPVPIYHLELWDTNYATRFYDICEHFLDNIYFSIFLKEAPAFLAKANTFIATMGDQYVGKYFAYFRIWGNNIVHMLPKTIPDRLVIEDVYFQIVTEGV